MDLAQKYIIFLKLCVFNILQGDYFKNQIKTAPLLAAATRFPSRQRAIDVISSGAPRNVLTTFPVAALQMRTDRSSLPEKIRLPSGENTTDVTLSKWPVRVMTSCPSPSDRKSVV